MTPELSIEGLSGQVRYLAFSVLVLMGLFLLDTTYRQREIRGATARIDWAEERLRLLEEYPAPDAAKKAAPPRPPRKATAGKATG